MSVKNTTDTLLLLEVAEHEMVILKYHTDDCGEPCTKFVPVFDNLSDSERYKDIVFLRIDAESNPVAKKFILRRGAPLLTIYRDGRLITSRYITTEAEIIDLLEMLPVAKDKKDSPNGLNSLTGFA